MGCTSSTNKIKGRRWVSGPYTSQTTETTTLTTTTQNQEKFTREDILLIFKAMDKDNNGYLTADEIRQTLVETKAYQSEEQVQKMISEADKDGDGRINYMEFTGVMDFVNSNP